MARVAPGVDTCGRRSLGWPWSLLADGSGDLLAALWSERYGSDRVCGCVACPVGGRGPRNRHPGAAGRAGGSHCWPAGRMRAKQLAGRIRMGGGDMEDMKSLYEHAGGEEALHRVEEVFYSKVLADPVLRTLFTERRPHHVDRLTAFTAESFGGPERFTREVGFQHIIDVHRHLKITDDQRERFVALYLESLDEAGLPNDERFRGAVRSHLECGSRLAQPNLWRGVAAHLHPIP